MTYSKKAKTVALIFMIVLGVIWIVPILWLFLSSFKQDSDFITSFANIRGPGDYLTRMIPRKWTVVNYVEMFVGGEGTNTTANILAMFKNSFIVSIAVTVGALNVTTLSA